MKCTSYLILSIFLHKEIEGKLSLRARRKKVYVGSQLQTIASAAISLPYLRMGDTGHITGTRVTVPLMQYKPGGASLHIILSYSYEKMTQVSHYRIIYSMNYISIHRMFDI